MKSVAAKFPDTLSDDKVALASIGQGDVLSTPLQNAMVAAAIANDGKLVEADARRPAVEASDLSTLSEATPEVMSTAFSSSTASKLNQMMQSVVEHDAPSLQLSGIKVAAKTGTAQIGSSNQTNDAWVIGFAPADNPKIAVSVVIHNVNQYGVEAAGPDHAFTDGGGPETMKLVEGQLIHRRYRLDRRLAQGGMGEGVERPRHPAHRPVAIKALRDDQGNVEAKLHRLRAEAHNSANLAHPNIAALFEYYEHDSIGFLIMEYVPSDSLADSAQRSWHAARDGNAADTIETARGLFVAHSHGVIHRDVKPANIMVSTTGEVKITDFGVSYSTNQEQITQDGMVVGTAQYISPEQAQGKQATPQSDIYSLGVVAYKGLCGHRPFTGTTPVDIAAAAHVNDPVPPLPDSIDVQLRQFVMSMLSKESA